MGWGSEHSAVKDFAHELREFLNEHGRKPEKEISAASHRLVARQRGAAPDNEAGEGFSTGWLSGTLTGTAKRPPNDTMIFSFVRAVLHVENPDADPITFEHDHVQELLELCRKARSQQALGLFRERHLRAALEDRSLDVQHGCFALYALDGAPLHIGTASESSETLATRIKATFEPGTINVSREKVAELEVWPLPDLVGAPDPEATVIHLRDTLMRKVIQPTPSTSLHLPHDNASDDAAIPQSRLFPLVNFGTLLAVREALQIQSTSIANHASAFADYASAILDRTEARYRRRRPS